MKDLIARIISIILNPLLLPSIGLLLIFISGTYLSLLPYQAKRIITIIVVVNTFLLPLLVLPLFYRLGIIKSLFMDSHKERLLPILFTLIPYLFTIYFLRQIPASSLLLQYMIGGTIILIISLVITLWWKVSIHMVAIGALVGLSHALSYLLYIDPLKLLIPSIITAGLVAWARLSLNAHKPSQIYVGFLIGWSVMLSSIIFL